MIFIVNKLKKKLCRVYPVKYFKKIKFYLIFCFLFFVFVIDYVIIYIFMYQIDID